MSWPELVPVVVASVGSGGVAGGALLLLTLRQQRRTMAATATDLEASATQRMLGGAASIVEQAATQTPALLERITRLEAALERHQTQLDAERSELQAWQQWGAVQMAWASQAVAAIRQLGGTIADPPQPPAVERRQNAAA